MLLYLVASIGFGVNNTVHNSYLADAYPTEGRGRVFSWHNLSDPLSGTIGLLLFGLVVSLTHDWRYGLLLGLAGFPVALLRRPLREPEKGANEASHILKSSGMDLQSQQEKAPRVLLGSAVTRLLRIRSLYFELVAVAILGFAGTGAPLFGNLFFHEKFHLGTAGRSEVETIIGVAGFLGLPVAYMIGDHYFRRAPQRPLAIAGFCISAYGSLFVISLYVPKLWLCVALQFVAQSAVAPLAICIFLTLAATAPRNADHLLRHVRRVLAGVRRFRRQRGARRGLRRHRRAARHRGRADPHRAGVCGRWCAAADRLALRAAGHHAGHRGRHRALRRGQTPSGRRQLPALQIHNLDFYYGTNQVLFDMNLEIAQGEMVALLGTNGAGKSTLLAPFGALAPPSGVVRIFGMNWTYLEPEQIIEEGVALLVGGKMTFSGVDGARQPARRRAHMRRDRARSAAAMAEALDAFPAWRPAWINPPARSRAASSRCWPWPGS